MCKYFKTHPFAKSGLLGIPLIIFVFVMGIFFPKGIYNEFSSFILAFEFAKTPSDITTIFNGLSSEEILNVDIGNYIDFGFMLTYSTLLALAFFHFSKKSRLNWLKYGIVLVVLILAGDFIENIFLLRLSNNVTINAAETILLANLKYLSFFTWTKWIGLAVAFVLLYTYFYFQRWHFKVLGILLLLPSLFLIASPQHTPDNLTIFTNLIFSSFAILVLFFFLFKRKP